MQQIWDDFLKIMKEETGSRVVETWFKAVSLKKWSAKEKNVILQTPNQFVTKWLQQHYTQLIKTHLCRLLHTTEINISFSCNIQKTEKNIIPATIIQSPKKESSIDIKQTNKPKKANAIILKKKNLPVIGLNQKSTGLNNAYSFNSFIVGPSNSLAHAAAYAVCQNLGKVYNPLFIYGGTGLGKTHLLHATGNEVKKKFPNKTIIYESSDRFTNEFISAIRLDKMHLFRAKYQKIDLLLLDDIQFLSNKEQTQETFFHIFNTLYEQKKQIILSSDTFPKEIKGLQKRLRSRLEWGLVTDIQMPDLETKIAILEKKAETNSINLNYDVANFIASRIISNIRELEGALIRVGAFSTLTNQEITLELTKKVLLHLTEKKKEGIMLEDILKIVAKYYFVSILDLKSKKRHKDIALVRQIALYMMKKLTFFSLQAIGEFVGKRNHSTVLHAISKIEGLIKKDESFSKKLKFIEQEIITC
ncbi:chromosomal replication initiator protein DnaA [Candidatus Dependentiae bacterium]